MKWDLRSGFVEYRTKQSALQMMNVIGASGVSAPRTP